VSDAASAHALKRVVLASNNPGKLREFAALLSTAGIDLVTQGELGVSEAEEPHVTFVENALAKARHASAATGLPALADDSGLCVHALRGAPGVYSARYAQLLNGGEKSDAANNARLVMVRHAADPEPLIAEGRWHGEVIDTPRGANGFGYDAHFLVPSLGQTAAELDPAVKNANSHRAIALRHLLARLKEIS